VWDSNKGVKRTFTRFAKVPGMTPCPIATYVGFTGHADRLRPWNVFADGGGQLTPMTNR